MASPAPGLRCRLIDKADIGAVASLLARGFPVHDRGFWLDAFAQLTRHEPPPGLPKYGYLLESGGVVVGAILLICSTVKAGDAVIPRCNLSSWYVEPAFRAYAPMLIAHALRHKDATYLNVSPAPHTLPIIEAQGFSRYCDGIFGCCANTPRTAASACGASPTTAPIRSCSGRAWSRALSRARS
jgi:hypothetical protein